MKYKLIAILLATGTCCPAFAQLTNLLSNPGFELQTMTSLEATDNAAIPGWAAGGYSFPPGYDNILPNYNIEAVFPSWLDQGNLTNAFSGTSLLMEMYGYYNYGDYCFVYQNITNNSPAGFRATIWAEDAWSQGISTVTNYSGKIKLESWDSTGTNMLASQLYSLPLLKDSAWHFFSYDFTNVPGTYNYKFVVANGWHQGAIMFDDVSLTALPAPALKINSINTSGPNVVLNGGNGAYGASYFVQQTTSLSAPTWSNIGTNQFDANGNFIFTNPLVPGASQYFYRVVQPVQP